MQHILEYFIKNSERSTSLKLCLYGYAGCGRFIIEKIRKNKVQYSTVQYSTVQYSTIQYSTIVCALCNKMIQKALMSPCTVNLSEPDFLNLNCGFPTTPRRALVYCVYATHIRVENNTIYVYRVSLSHTLT